MANESRHPRIDELEARLREGAVSRREFLRTATLLGLSAGAAFTLAGLAVPRTAQADMPRGGTVRIAMRVMEIDSPPTYSWVEQSNVARQVLEYLTHTGADNITRPYLLERWEPSEDLLTWDLHVRSGIHWHNGRPFTVDDVLWNLRRVLDPDVGSSILGLMRSYMLTEVETGEIKDDEPVKRTQLWADNAIEQVDDNTIRLRLSQPQLAIPEHLFHYPFLIMDPEDEGVFGVGANGTGAFRLVDHRIGMRSALEANSDYWGNGPYLDRLVFEDAGDDPSAPMSALVSRQVDGLYTAQPDQLITLDAQPHVKIYATPTGTTAVARMKTDHAPFDDPRVRKAMRLAIDPDRVVEIATINRGVRAEHHHVSPIHPEYYELPFMGQDIEEAKRLLAEAGHPDGFETAIACKPDPVWELQAVQVMVEMWKAIGVDVKIDVMPSAQYWDVWTEVPFGFTTWVHRPLGVMVLSLAYRSGAPWNESGYANPELDALLDRAEGVVDPVARSEIVAEIQRLMQDEGPIVQPSWTTTTTAYDERVLGFQVHPTSYIFGNELALES